MIGPSSIKNDTLAKNANTLMHQWQANGQQVLRYNATEEICVINSDEVISSFSQDKQILIYHFAAMHDFIKKKLKELKHLQITDLHTLYRALMMNHGLYKTANNHYHSLRQKVKRLQSTELIRNPQGLTFIQKQLNVELDAIVSKNFELLFNIMSLLSQRMHARRSGIHFGWHLMANISTPSQLIEVECNLNAKKLEEVGLGAFPLLDQFTLRFANRYAVYFSFLGSFNFAQDLPTEITSDQFENTILNPGQYIQNAIDPTKPFKPIIFGYKPFNLAFMMATRPASTPLIKVSFQVLVELALLQECAAIDLYAPNSFSTMLYALGFDSKDTTKPTMQEQEVLVHNSLKQKTLLFQLSCKEFDHYRNNKLLFRHFRLDMAKIADRIIMIPDENLITTWATQIKICRLLNHSTAILPMPYHIPIRPFTPSFKSIRDREIGRRLKQNGMKLEGETVDFSCLNSTEKLVQEGQASRFDTNALTEHMTRLSIKPSPKTLQ